MADHKDDRLGRRAARRVVVPKRHSLGASLTPSDERLTGVLAEVVLGWKAGPDRFALGNRRWLPRWRFQPLTKLDDAGRLLEQLRPEGFRSGSKADSHWAVVTVRAGMAGEAMEPSLPRAITVAIARALEILPPDRSVHADGVMHSTVEIGQWLGRKGRP